ncbi:MAG: hypothetical protein Q3998_06705, partial [Porphyromonas sp.]|nr:hypothetical protein [Porphyromonas sp.]
FGFELVPLSEDLKISYNEEICQERKIRKVAREFYRAIGIDDIDTMMMNIVGDKILDWQIYKNNYLAFFDSDNDIDVECLLYELLSKHGLPDLIEESSGDNFTLYEKFFREDEEVSPYDRVILYADSIREKGKLLFSLESGVDIYQFGIIEDTPEAKMRLCNSMDKVIECDEFESYVIFDSEEKRMFLNLLSDINWTLDGKNLFTEKDIREKFYRENLELMSQKQADEYLSRISLIKPEMTICLEDLEGKEIEFSVKAENGRYFTNSNLLLQIHQKLLENKDFRNFLMENKTPILGLKLSINRDKYFLLYDSSM